MAEALILGADVVTAAEGLLEGQCKVMAWHCPYCGKTMLSQEEAFQHDSVCEKHPMAERVARFEDAITEAGVLMVGGNVAGAMRVLETVMTESAMKRQGI